MQDFPKWLESRNFCWLSIDHVHICCILYRCPLWAFNWKLNLILSYLKLWLCIHYTSITINWFFLIENSFMIFFVHTCKFLMHCFLWINKFGAILIFFFYGAYDTRHFKKQLHTRSIGADQMQTKKTIMFGANGFLASGINSLTNGYAVCTVLNIYFPFTYFVKWYIKCYSFLQITPYKSRKPFLVDIQNERSNKHRKAKGCTNVETFRAIRPKWI